MNPSVPPEDWYVLEKRGISVATPALLHLLQNNRPERVSSNMNYQANHDGVRYQVSLLPIPPDLSPTPSDYPSYFKSFFGRFVRSAEMRYVGSFEQLRVAEFPAAQAVFEDGTQSLLSRAVLMPEQMIVLTVLTGGTVDEANPALGGGGRAAANQRRCGDVLRLEHHRAASLRRE